MDKNKNHVEEEDDLSFLGKLNDIGGDEIFSEFMSQSPVDFSDLQQYTDDEMSYILAQGTDDSLVGHVSPTAPMASTVELPPPDLKRPRTRQSKYALEESAVPNPRRSKRIMLKRESGTKSENMRWIEEFVLEQNAESSETRRRARAADIATLETETMDQSGGNTTWKELHETMVNEMQLQDPKNDHVKKGVQWLKMTASDPTMPSVLFPGYSADLLPNLQGHQYSAEVFPRFARPSSSAAGGIDALPRSTAYDDSWPENSSGNNSLAKGSGKSSDSAPN